ncbi:hypothetical protein DPMN_082647 [Dreissena polymorpha]|uniref:Uncharacterized protein n=1 Tax=Dreissena polymorpha TaxID=45954 RepID=A0A9D3Y9M5_DREPO|nr:hypothetical protein DPMN_082647 [Dreissena polymorpha]
MSRTRTCTNPATMALIAEDMTLTGNCASNSFVQYMGTERAGLRDPTVRPDRFGNNCNGDASEYSIYQMVPCINPAWSGCFVSCDVGLLTRSRTCDNPKPNKYGEYCSGVGFENAVCLNDPCGTRSKFSTALVRLVRVVRLFR